MQVMLGLSSMALWARISLASPAAERDAGGAAEPYEGARAPACATRKTTSLNPASAAQWSPCEVACLLAHAVLHLRAMKECALAVRILRGVPWQCALARVLLSYLQRTVLLGL